MKVDGCRVVITGGASGIGLAIARQLADRGCQIVLADIDAAALTNCADERDTFHTFTCDVTQQHALEAGDFYIFTHHCNRDMISERLSAQLDAIDRQTQPDDGSESCNTRSLLGRLFDQIVA